MVLGILPNTQGYQKPTSQLHHNKFMDCFASLAMTKGGREVVMDCFASLAMTKKGTVIARVRRTRGNLDMVITIPNQNSSLRRPKACGNLIYSCLVIARL